MTESYERTAQKLCFNFKKSFLLLNGTLGTASVFWCPGSLAVKAHTARCGSMVISFGPDVYIRSDRIIYVRYCSTVINLEYNILL